MNLENADTERRKIILVVFALLLMLLTTVGTSVLHVRAETTIEKPVNFVLVLDCSGSMWKRNDQDGLTQKSAKMFVDKLQHENTNLSIVVFGCDYGNDAFDVGSRDPGSKNRVKVAFPLQDISSVEARNNAKKVIEEETGRQEEKTMTPIGYALQAANAVLEEAETDIDHAAIILLSDGQVEGQDDGYNKDSKNIAHDYYSVDEAAQTAADNKWPIYAMELNYLKKNMTGEGLPGVGYHLMREKIPAVTGTDPLELTSSDQASELFNQIFYKYFHIEDSGPVEPISLNETYSFHVDDLTVESTIDITGDIEKVKNLKIESPSKSKDIDLSGGYEKTGDHILVVEDGYIVLTLLVPEPGDWTLKIEGEGKYKYKLSRLSLQESSLQLHATQEGGEVERGTKVDFTASYIYNDHQFESEALYNDHPAKLVIKGIESIDMEAGESNYYTSYKFEKSGSYTVFVRVEDDMFRQGYKDSGGYTFTIQNAAPEVTGSIQDQSVDVGKELPAINVARLFSDPEGDQMTYTLKAPSESGIKETMTSDGKMVIKAGNLGGEFKVKIMASDGSRTSELPFRIKVIQHPMELICGNKIVIELVTDDPEKTTKEIFWNDLFSDPDGYVPDITIEESSNKGIEKTNISGGVSFHAVGKGDANYTVKALDANDPSVIETVTIRVYAKTKRQKFFETIKPFLFGLLGLLLFIGVVYKILFSGRYKNYGIWDINNEFDVLVSSYGVAKKSSFKLDSLLDAIGEPSGFGNVRISAGTNLNRKVYIENLSQVERAESNGNDIDEKDGKRMEFKKGMEIRIENAGIYVTLFRH